MGSACVFGAAALGSMAEWWLDLESWMRIDHLTMTLYPLRENAFLLWCTERQSLVVILEMVDSERTAYGRKCGPDDR